MMLDTHAKHSSSVRVNLDSRRTMLLESAELHGGSSRSQGSFFIPGINGKARCLADEQEEMYNHTKIRNKRRFLLSRSNSTRSIGSCSVSSNDGSVGGTSQKREVSSHSRTIPTTGLSRSTHSRSTLLSASTRSTNFDSASSFCGDSVDDQSVEPCHRDNRDSRRRRYKQDGRQPSLRSSNDDHFKHLLSDLQAQKRAADSARQEVVELKIRFEQKRRDLSNSSVGSVEEDHKGDWSDDSTTDSSSYPGVLDQAERQIESLQELQRDMTSLRRQLKTYTPLSDSPVVGSRV